ncbi:hypothetical protein B0H10DRAFT_2438402 [Mycena sp. CBHHK59/15]|nr:hypothetical protein B0H10DRAFT_2438402 [Mycena sp. CBHHK59/15]
MSPRTKTSPKYPCPGPYKEKTQLRTMTARTLANGSRWQESSPSLNGLKAKDTGPEYYEISQIRDRRVTGKTLGKTGRYEYLVRWLGWPPESDEWVDEKHLNLYYNRTQDIPYRELPLILGFQSAPAYRQSVVRHFRHHVTTSN